MFLMTDIMNNSCIFDKMELSCKLGKVVFSSEFYTPSVWKIIENLHVQGKLKTDFSAYGIFDDAERRIIKWGIGEEDYPIRLVKVEAKSKFETLEHRHYLGSILALGIKREKIGDVILQEDGCYFPTFMNIYEFIRLNLTKINRTTCKVKLVDEGIFPEVKFEDLILNINSYRLDAIVASLGKVSRALAQEFLKKGLVQVNFTVCEDKDKKINFGDIITIRKKGKFKMVELIKRTQSDRLKVLFKKYS